MRRRWAYCNFSQLYLHVAETHIKSMATDRLSDDEPVSNIPRLDFPTVPQQSYHVKV